MILNWILTETGREVLDWIFIMREREKWRAVVNAVMNFRAIKCGKYLEQLRSSYTMVFIYFSPTPLQL
jgi:hypothetical protein